MSEGKKQNLKYRDTNIGYFLKIQSEIFQQVLELPNFHIVCCQLLIVEESLLWLSFWEHWTELTVQFPQLWIFITYLLMIECTFPHCSFDSQTKVASDNCYITTLSTFGAKIHGRQLWVLVHEVKANISILFCCDTSRRICNGIPCRICHFISSIRTSASFFLQKLMANCSQSMPEVRLCKHSRWHQVTPYKCTNMPLTFHNF